MATLVRKSITSAYIMTDDLEATRATIESHATRLGVSLKALMLDRSVTTFPTAGMDSAERNQINATFGHVPEAIHQIELRKGPGGMWIGDAMLKTGEARNA